MATSNVSFGPYVVDNSTIDQKLNWFCAETSGPPPAAARAVRLAWVDQKVYEFVQATIRAARKKERDATERAASQTELDALTFSDGG